MKRGVQGICVMLYLLLLTACHRQELEQIDLSKARIPVSIDWSVADINPQNVTMFFYHTADGTLAFEHYFENNSNSVQSYVSVPVGSYTVVVFNELPGQIENIKIKGRQKLSTLEAYGVQETSVTMPLPGDIYWREPGMMASIIVRDFVVTPDMLYFANSNEGQTRCDGGQEVINKKLMGLVPLMRICEFKIQVRIENLNMSRMPVLVNLRNMAGSYLFDSDRDGPGPVTYQFTMADRVYDDGSKTSGMVSGSTLVFGLPDSRKSISPITKERPLYADMKFMLVDAEKTIDTRNVDITSLLAILPYDNGKIVLEAKLYGVEDLTNVTPEGSEDSGFNSSVADWEVIDVPLEAQ